MPSRDELSMLSWHAEQTQAQNTGNKLGCKSNAALRKHEQKLACNNFGTKQGEMGSVQTATHRGVGTAWMWSPTTACTSSHRFVFVFIFHLLFALSAFSRKHKKFIAWSLLLFSVLFHHIGCSPTHSHHERKEWNLEQGLMAQFHQSFPGPSFLVAARQSKDWSLLTHESTPASARNLSKSSSLLNRRYACTKCSGTDGRYLPPKSSNIVDAACRRMVSDKGLSFVAVV